MKLKKENIETQKILSQIEFLSSLKIFQHLSHSSMKKLFFHLTMQIFKRNSFVFKEYEKAEDFFIIKSGSFKILKQVLIKTPKFEENPNFSEFLDETTFNVIDKLKIKTANSFKKNFEICILGPGEIFGENDLVEEKVRESTVICDSELGELYKITNQVKIFF